MGVLPPVHVFTATYAGFSFGIRAERCYLSYRCNPLPESMQPGFIGGIPGGMEVGVVLILTVLLFGADRIPRLAQSVGESMGATGTGDD